MRVDWPRPFSFVPVLQRYVEHHGVDADVDDGLNPIVMGAANTTGGVMASDVMPSGIS
jgi:hypothetical protein